MPNQPKTPISTFRLDEETKDKLRGAARSMDVSMSEALRNAINAMEAFSKAYAAIDPERAYRERSIERSKRGEATVAALAESLMDRDWPSATPRERNGHRYEYACRAAAILNGEAWAIKKTWPEAAFEIAANRPA